MHLYFLNVYEVDDAHGIVYQIRYFAKIFILFLSSSLFGSVCDQLKFVLCIDFEIVVYDVCVWFFNFLRLLYLLRLACQWGIDLTSNLIVNCFVFDNGKPDVLIFALLKLEFPFCKHLLWLIWLFQGVQLFLITACWWLLNG